MGETHLFLESIQNSANFSGWLENSIEGTTHFAFHNSPGFLIFVPFVWAFSANSTYLFFILNSLALILSNYFITIFANNKLKILQICSLLFISLCLSALTQHAKFIDTRFSTLGLSLFIIGILLERKLFFLLGFTIALLFRETTVLTCVTILIFTRDFPFSTLLKKKIIIFGCIWIGFSFLLINYLQPKGLSLGAGPMNRLTYEVSYDWDLKLAYILRIISFGPLVIFSITGIAGVFSEIIFPIFSKDYVLYNISWHYWISGVCISFIYSFIILKERFFENRDFLKGYSIFIMNTGIWQFITTFSLGLY